MSTIGGIPTLIGSAHTARNASSVAITSGIDSTYDEYAFVYTDIGPATVDANFGFQVNASGQSGYNETITSSSVHGYAAEPSGSLDVAYNGAHDQAQGTALQHLGAGIDNAAKYSAAGILLLFNPANTTYVKHFIARTHFYEDDNSRSMFLSISGYINVTAAIDEIEFKMSTGNFDGVIQMYGIA